MVALLTYTPNSITSPETFNADMDGHLGELNPMIAGINAALATLGAVASGAAMSIPYTFDSTIADADPGAGKLRLSSATQNASTVIRVDLAGADGSTWTNLIDTFDDSTSAVKGHIMLQCLSDATKWLLFSVASLASPSGYKNLTVAPVASSATSPFVNGDSLVLKFARTGDKGDTGAAGANGTNGTNGGLVLVAAATPAAATNMDDFLNTFTSTYDNYLILGRGVTFGADDGLDLRLANSGSADAGSNYVSLANGPDLNSSTTATSLPVSSGATIRSGGKGCNFEITVLNANDTGRFKCIQTKIIWNDTTGTSYIYTSKMNAYIAGNAVTGFRLFARNGNSFAVTGRVRVYAYLNT